MTAIHLGAAGEPELPGTIKMAGKLKFRQAAALIDQADLHVGIVSSLMHAAEAVRTPAIIIFGGFEPFSAYDYRSIHPIEASLDCSPCAPAGTSATPCAKGMACMKSITPDQVMREIESTLRAPGPCAKKRHPEKTPGRNALPVHEAHAPGAAEEAR
jgi:ADP-heptose:LPS heptosyltransferase